MRAIKYVVSFLIPCFSLSGLLLTFFHSKEKYKTKILAQTLHKMFFLTHYSCQAIHTFQNEFYLAINLIFFTFIDLSLGVYQKSQVGLEKNEEL